jgi:hypothetical protein
MRTASPELNIENAHGVDQLAGPGHTYPLKAGTTTQSPSHHFKLDSRLKYVKDTTIPRFVLASVQFGVRV